MLHAVRVVVSFAPRRISLLYSVYARGILRRRPQDDGPSSWDLLVAQTAIFPLQLVPLPTVLTPGGRCNEYSSKSPVFEASRSRCGPCASYPIVDTLVSVLSAQSVIMCLARIRVGPKGASTLMSCKITLNHSAAKWSSLFAHGFRLLHLICYHTHKVNFFGSRPDHQGRM